MLIANVLGKLNFIIDMLLKSPLFVANEFSGNKTRGTNYIEI